MTHQEFGKTFSPKPSPMTWLNHLIAGLVISMSVMLYFWPLIQQSETHLVDGYDSLFIATVIRYVQDHLVTGQFFELFEADFFYPHIQVLAFSDLFLTDALMSLPARLLSDEPVFVFNYALLLSQLMTMVMVYFLLHAVSEDHFISVLLSLVFSYSTIRLHYLPHLQMFSLQWMLLSLLSMVEYIKTQHRHWVVVGKVGFVLSVWNSFLPGMFLLLVFVGLWLLSPRLRQLVMRDIKLFLMAIVVAIMLIGPIVWPYLSVSKRYDYVRPLTEVIHFSMSPEELIGKFFSPGLYLTIFVGLVIWWRRRSTLIYSWIIGIVNAFGILSLASLAMALGPALHWMRETVKIPWHVPLPYIAFYYLVPGFKGFRTPSRWVGLAGLLGMVWAAWYLRKLSPKIRLLMLFCLGMVTWLVIPSYPLTAIPSHANHEAVFSKLTQLPTKPLIELPIYSWSGGEHSRQEVVRMHLQSLHDMPLINGYSGFHPPAFESLVAQIQQAFPDKSVFSQIREYADISYVLIHTTELTDIYEATEADVLELVVNEDVIYKDEAHILVAL